MNIRNSKLERKFSVTNFLYSLMTMNVLQNKTTKKIVNELLQIANEIVYLNISIKEKKNKSADLNNK